MASKPFKHEPLDLKRPSFRLLRLLSGSGPEISCDIFHAFLDECESNTVPFEALSYTWGSTNHLSGCGIELTHGKRLDIGANLFDALRNMRLVDRDRILWVDAICINQEDPQERGHQVQQMGNIYKQADRVLFWLGLATFGTDVAMESLSSLQKIALQYPCREWKRSDKRWHTLWEQAQELTQARLCCRELETLQRNGLTSLLSRAWFTRVWILQEVSNARSALVCCGSKSVSARFFALSPRLMDVKPNGQCQAVLDIMPGSSRDGLRKHSQMLYNLLCAFRESQAKDPRDMIYALLGLSQDAIHYERLRPDYEKDEEDLVRDVVRFLYLCDLDQDQTPTTIRDLLGRLWYLNHPALEVLASQGDRRKMAILLERNGVTATRDVFAAASRIGSRAFEDILGLILQSGLERGDVSYRVISRHPALFGPQARVRFASQGPGTRRSPEGNHAAAALIIQLHSGLEKDKGQIYVDVAAPVPPLILWMAQKTPRSPSDRTLLTLAAEEGNEPVVAALLGQNTNGYTHRRDRQGRTSLSWAAGSGHEAVARRLLEAGSDIQTRDENGLSPLGWAASEGHDDVLALLLHWARGTQLIQCRDDQGRTPLTLAVCRGHLSTVRRLLAEKAQLESRCLLGRTPLFWAVLHGHEKVIDVLLIRGADPNSRDRCRADEAAEKPLGIVSDQAGQSILSLAAGAGQNAIVTMLIAAGAELDAVCGEGRTPLSRACEGGHVLVVKQLLSSGAATGIVDRSGKSPADWARRMEHGEIVEMLGGK